MDHFQQTIKMKTVIDRSCATSVQLIALSTLLPCTTASAVPDQFGAFSIGHVESTFIDSSRDDQAIVDI